MPYQPNNLFFDKHYNIFGVVREIRTTPSFYRSLLVTKNSFNGFCKFLQAFGDMIDCGTVDDYKIVFSFLIIVDTDPVIADFVSLTLSALSLRKWPALVVYSYILQRKLNAS